MMSMDIDRIEFQPWEKFEKRHMDFPSFDRTPKLRESRYLFDEKEQCYRNTSVSNRFTATIMCAGDVMCEPSMSSALMVRDSRKFFFEHAFERVKQVLYSADLAIANLETMVSERAPYAYEIHSYEGRYHCNAPKEYLDGLRYAGFDAFVLANNHNMDAGAEGIFDTVRNIENKGFMHTGLFTSEDDPRALVVNVNGIKLGILSYTERINSNLDKKMLNPLGQKTLVNRYSLSKLQEDVKKAKERGAEFILCYIHFRCKEYSHKVILHQKRLAREIAEAGVDCIMGSHSHSLQRYDAVYDSNGRRVPVVYSLGNFMTSDNTSMITRKSIIYKLVLNKQEGKVSIAGESYIPCRIIEDVGSQMYTIWPTAKEWDNGREREILVKAEEEIKAVIGNKILPDHRMIHNQGT